MPLTLSRLSKKYPLIRFVKSDDFRWSPEKTTIYYADETSPLLLHELGHALLNHQEYRRDIELLAMERDAWDTARTLDTISEEIIQNHLDTYREWLHARSTCPTCGANGHQVKKLTYHCIACETDWRVNEARLCGLKRYKTKTPQ
jgi:hypothetical protein